MSTSKVNELLLYVKIFAPYFRSCESKTHKKGFLPYFDN